MTRVFFLSPTGRAFVEEVNPKFRLMEFKDGYHPLSNDAIWRSDDEEDDGGVVFVWQGRSSPEGQNPDRVRFVMKETNRLKDNKQSLMVSRMWVRRILIGLKYVALLVAFSFAMYVVYIVGTVD